MSDLSEENDEMSTTAVRNLRPELQVTESTPHEQVTTTIPTGLSATKVITDESSLCTIVAGLKFKPSLNEWHESGRNEGAASYLS